MYFIEWRENDKKMIYKYYKGEIYNAVGIGKHTETNEDLVFYEDLNGKMWARPYDNFMGTVDSNGEEIKRFKHLGEFYKI